MQIWVDADACPGAIRDLLCRTAKKRQVLLTFVANQPVKTPASEYIDMILVPGGVDVADEKIVDELTPGDLVITADIPLAANVVEKGGIALTPRGQFYNNDNVAEALAIRNLKDTLRTSGMELQGPAAFNQRDRQKFANQLDKFLTKYL